MNFVKKHIWWFVAAGLVLYFGSGTSSGAPTFETSSTWTPGGSGRTGGGATGGW
jgi:hypothetical protein